MTMVGLSSFFINAGVTGIRAVYFIILSISFSCFAANIEEGRPTWKKILKDKSFKVCSESGFLPYEMKDAFGKWHGYDYQVMKDFVEYISKKMNTPISLQFIDTQWDGIIPALQTGKCDAIASAMAKTPVREKAVLFSTATHKESYVAAYLTSSPLASSFKTLSDIDKGNIKISLKTGSSSDLVFSKLIKNSKIYRFTSDIDTIQAVIDKKTDVTIYDKTYIEIVNKQKKQVLSYIPTNQGQEIAVAFRKTDTNLAEVFNEFFADWTKNGSYENYRRYYFDKMEWLTRFSIK